MGSTEKFYVSIPKINGEDPQITAFCSVNYKKPSLCIRVRKKEHAQLIKQNLEQVLNGTDAMNFKDGFKKMLYLDEHSTTVLTEKTTVKSQRFISPFGYKPK
jgi:hypothetical protein